MLYLEHCDTQVALGLHYMRGPQAGVLILSIRLSLPR